MAIKIYHKYCQSLVPSNEIKKIDTIIIGTFNPGLPNMDLLNETEKKQFEEIRNNKKFKEFCENKNFYDRSQNRFWKVMDILYNPTFYRTKYNTNFKIKNLNGLKFYKNMDRDKTFNRQNKFCLDNNIFITDIIKSIESVSFCGIYDIFSDDIIEKSKPDWNTLNIEKIIIDFSPTKILVDFDFEKKQETEITKQIKNLKNKFKDISFIRILSPSGAAKKSYSELYYDWKNKVPILKTNNSN